MLSFGIGVILAFLQIEGIRPVSRQKLNRACKELMTHGNFSISYGILSGPIDFPRIARNTTFSISPLLMGMFKGRVSLN